MNNFHHFKSFSLFHDVTGEKVKKKKKIYLNEDS